MFEKFTTEAPRAQKITTEKKNSKFTTDSRQHRNKITTDSRQHENKFTTDSRHMKNKIATDPKQPKIDKMFRCRKGGANCPPKKP